MEVSQSPNGAELYSRGSWWREMSLDIVKYDQSFENKRHLVQKYDKSSLGSVTTGVEFSLPYLLMP